MKEIVISRMYSGEYLDANLGHEVINLFKADDGKHYIYLNHDGCYSDKHVNNGKLTFDRILFVKPIGDNAVEVVAKAEGLTMLYDPTQSASDNRNTQLSLSCNISYGGSPLQRIFFGAAQQEVNVTFEAEKVLTPTKSICLEFVPKSNAKNVRSHQQEYDIVVTLKDTKLGQGLKSYVQDSSSDYADLQQIMDNDQLWEDTIQMVNLNTLATKIPQTTYLDICGRSYDEVAYSNAIAHFMGKYPELVREWINTSFSSTNRPFQPGIMFAGNILNVKREWGDSTGRVDILFYVYNGFLCAIENKLLSTLSDLVYDVDGHVIKSQLDKYYDILQEFENQNISANNSSQINMPHGIHLLLPDYHPLLRHLDPTPSPKPYMTGQPPISTKYDTLSGYIVIRYSQVYHFLLPYLKKKPYKDDALFVEFVHSLERHTHEQEDGRYWDMVRQFVNKIQNNPIP